MITGVDESVRFSSSSEQDETMAMIDRWRRKLESKYQVIVNGHDDATARGGEKKGDGEKRSFSGSPSGLQ